MENKPSILYVDDEEINLRLFKLTFRRDFNIFTAESAEEGMQILETHKIDVVVTDQRMPEITGVEFLKKINDKFPDIPPNRLMVSGFAHDDDIEEAFQHYRLYKFVQKPWNAESLKNIILESILDNYER